MRESRTARLRIMLFALVLGSCVGTATLAKITAISVNPEPVYVCQVTTYGAVDDGNGPDEFVDAAWEIGPFGCVPQQNVHNVAGDNSGCIQTETRVGAFIINVRPGYQDDNGILYYTARLTRNVTVAGPDRDVIDSGLNVDSEYNAQNQTGNILVTFRVLGGTRPQQVDMSVDGYAQLRIRRPQSDYDSGFFDPGSNYSLTDVINDEMYVSITSVDFMNANIGDDFDDLYLQNRMVIKDGCGNDQFFYFTERHFQKVKTSNTSWKLLQITD